MKPLLRAPTTRILPRARHLSLLAAIAGVAPALAAPVVFHVTLGAASAQPVSGRLLVFAKAIASADRTPVARVDIDQIDTQAAAIAAREVAHLDPGATIDLDADLTAFPRPFSQLAPGRYAVQAVLDRDHGYNYAGRGPGDLVSGVVEMTLPGDATAPLTLATAIEAAVASAGPRDAETAAHVQRFDIASPALSGFWGRPIGLRGWVVTPPGYPAASGDRYPTVYFTQGFGATLDTLRERAEDRWLEMKAGKTPPMIWVAIDQSSPTGTSEFVDSANNGPWGRAVATELIPELERRYRMDATSAGRLLTAHSSGAWAVLWLQIRYPRLFGGAWPTSPDPVDFHDFLGIDLYAPGANVYRRPDGTSRPLARDKGQVLVALEDYTRREVVLGDYGGQLGSFDWVFSPRGPDGRPLPMFDRTTGAVDPAVIAAWRDHYDVSELLRRQWPELAPDLDGKLHVTVGTADTFYLDGAVHRLEATMKQLRARTDFRYLEGRSHFDLYAVDGDPKGLYRSLAREMYAVARPGARP